MDELGDVGGVVELGGRKSHGEGVSTFRCFPGDRQLIYLEGGRRDTFKAWESQGRGSKLPERRGAIWAVREIPDFEGGGVGPWSGSLDERSGQGGKFFPGKRGGSGSTARCIYGGGNSGM